MFAIGSRVNIPPLGPVHVTRGGRRWERELDATEAAYWEEFQIGLMAPSLNHCVVDLDTMKVVAVLDEGIQIGERAEFWE